MNNLSKVIEIGDLKVEKNSKKHGFLKVGERALATVSLPVTVINGKNPGPVLCCTAGVHGREYAGIQALIKLRSEIQPSQIKGTLILFPVCNVDSFNAKTYVSPVDGVNLNTVFPGKADGTMTARIAYTIFNVVKNSDYYVDCHGGDEYEIEIPYVIYHKTGNAELDKKSDGIARALGIKFVNSRTGFSPGVTNMEAAKAGVPSIMVEWSTDFGRLLEDEVMVHYDGIINIMKHIGMVEGTPRKVAEQKLVTRNEWMKTTTGGLMHLKKKPGDYVAKGDAIAEITNLMGELVETVKSTIDGTILFMYTYAAVSAGDNVCMVAA